MATDDTLVHSMIYAAPPGREPQPFRITLGVPLAHPEGDFVCRTDMAHMPQPKDVGGVDALQALVLAVAYLHMEFKQLTRAGWRFYLEPDGSAFDPCSIYFPPKTWGPAA